MQDLLEILRAMASKRDQVENRRELFHEVAERVVKHACSAFAAKPDGEMKDSTPPAATTKPAKKVETPLEAMCWALLSSNEFLFLN